MLLLLFVSTWGIIERSFNAVHVESVGWWIKIDAGISGKKMVHQHIVCQRRFPNVKDLDRVTDSPDFDHVTDSPENVVRLFQGLRSLSDGDLSLWLAIFWICTCFASSVNSLPRAA